MSNPKAQTPQTRQTTDLSSVFQPYTKSLQPQSPRIEQHLIDKNILREEQKGCRKNSRGYKEQLIIDSEIIGQSRKEHRNLHIGYIDYKKAFDSIPHSWLIRALEIYKINKNLRQFLAQIMKIWKIKIHLKTQIERIQIEELYMRRGFASVSLHSPIHQTEQTMASTSDTKR